MTLRNELISRVMLMVLYFLSILRRIKIFLGLIKVKHSLIGYFQRDGVVYSTNSHTEKRIQACQEYANFRSDDVVIFTYPKAGTHFTADIINSIYKEKGLISSLPAGIPFTPFELSVPSLSSGQQAGNELTNVDAAPSPRRIMTHLPWDLLPQKVRDGEVKVIHCWRNPKDVLCSMFSFVKTLNLILPETTLDYFVLKYIEGNSFGGGYFRFMKTWYPNRNAPNLLNLCFEDMKKDLEGNVRKIAQFLEIDLTDDQVRRVATANTFANKKKEKGKSHIMYRKGMAGGWRSTLTVEQNAMLDEWIQGEMEDMEDLKIEY